MKLKCDTIGCLEDASYQHESGMLFCDDCMEKDTYNGFGFVAPGEFKSIESKNK